jgi:hypothetical protein
MRIVMVCGLCAAGGITSWGMLVSFFFDHRWAIIIKLYCNVTVDRNQW